MKHIPPACMWWYHQTPSASSYRSSSDNSTGPYTSFNDPSGRPGAFSVTKYVPESELIAEREARKAAQIELRELRESMTASAMQAEKSAYERGFRAGINNPF